MVYCSLAPKGTKQSDYFAALCLLKGSNTILDERRTGEGMIIVTRFPIPSEDLQVLGLEDRGEE